jgi:hypothetical protein
VTQLELLYEPMDSLSRVACGTRGSQTQTVASALQSHLSPARARSEVSEDDGATLEYEFSDAELIDSMMVDGLAWEDAYAEEVCVPRFGPI